MGLLTLFSKPPVELLKLTAGSFTVDRNGQMLVSTLPQTFPESAVQKITTTILAVFRSAHEAHLPLAEVIVNYPSLTITARELRGGALIFMTPREPSTASRASSPV